MSPLARVAAFVGICCWVALCRYAPEVLGLGDGGRFAWLAVPGLVVPLFGVVACSVAARVSLGGDRAAWRNFAIGCALYLVGNTFHVYFAASATVVSFPTAPELSFFLMAVFFALGIFQYGAARELISRIQVYNFALILCGVAVGAAFLLQDNVAASQLTPLGTVFAFTYPALWFSVAAFGLVCVLLYAERSKRFPFLLLIAAVFAEAIADFMYASGLMAGTFAMGGLPTTLWILSAALIPWAAFEQILLARRDRGVTNRVVVTVGRRRFAEASVPAFVVGAVLVSAWVSAHVGEGGEIFFVLAVPIVVAFAVVVGFREQWALSIERDLRHAATRSEEALAVSRQHLTSVLESTTDGVIVLDRDWRVVFFNRQAAASLEARGGLRLGGALGALFPNEIGSPLDESFKEMLATGEPRTFEYYREDTDVWLDVRAFPSPDGISVFFHDISDARRIREEITYLAHHDVLTGLANRRLFHDQLCHGIGRGEPVATLFLDLDHFKEVNDTLGHPVGDMLLTELAQRLRGCVAAGDVVARLGGDEFAVLHMDATDREAIAALSTRLLRAMSEPFLIDGRVLRIGATIGIAVAPEDGRDPDRIFKSADIALYFAKGEKRGTFRFFVPEMEARLEAKQALKVELATAMGRNELELAFQPIVALGTDEVAALEVLLRWNHPERGIVSPADFVPVAEETGLIMPIGRWVLENACAAAVHWPDRIGVSVNLSPVQFAEAGLPDMVQAILADTGLAPHRLELEITEAALLQDTEANLFTLRRLRALGIQIALDDFGTGYASLGYLKKFPFTSIKIDRSFITNLPDELQSQAIVLAVTGLGRALGMRITAEGVETRQQLDRVRSLGCDGAQGYFFSRPVAAAAVPGVVDKLSETRKFWGGSRPQELPPASHPRLPLGQA